MRSRRVELSIRLNPHLIVGTDVSAGLHVERLWKRQDARKLEGEAGLSLDRIKTVSKPISNNAWSC
jgi:hypothetical protein